MTNVANVKRLKSSAKSQNCKDGRTLLESLVKAESHHIGVQDPGCGRRQVPREDVVGLYEQRRDAPAERAMK